MNKTTEYKRSADYGGRISQGNCQRCGERKVIRREPSLGRWVAVCKPCWVELNDFSTARETPS